MPREKLEEGIHWRFFMEVTSCQKLGNRQLPITLTERMNASNRDNSSFTAEGDDKISEEVFKLPLSKIKQIFNTDPENPTAFKKAHIAAGISTQIFIEKFIEQAVTIHQLQSNSSSSNRLTYDDLAEASHVDPFVFLKLLIPPRVELIDAYNNEQLRYCFMDDKQTALDAMKRIGLVNEKGVPRDEDFSESESEEDKDDYEEEEAVKKLNLAEKIVPNGANDADDDESGEEEEEEEEDEDEDEEEEAEREDEDML